MAHLDRADFGVPEVPWTIRHKLDQRYVEFFCRTRRSREGRFHLTREPLLNGRWAGDGQRLRALCHELSIQDEERHAATMIRVVMGEEDQINRIAVDAKSLHRDQR